MTDLKMPEGDGFSILESLKSKPAYAIIPTIVFSSSSDLDDIKKSYWLGACAYHIKPQNFNALCTQLKILFEYWSTCDAPEVDSAGKQLTTESHGKMGQRFEKQIEEEQHPQR